MPIPGLSFHDDCEDDCFGDFIQLPSLDCDPNYDAVLADKGSHSSTHSIEISFATDDAGSSVVEHSSRDIMPMVQPRIFTRRSLRPRPFKYRERIDTILTTSDKVSIADDSAITGFSVDAESTAKETQNTSLETEKSEESFDVPGRMTYLERWRKGMVAREISSESNSSVSSEESSESSSESSSEDSSLEQEILENLTIEVDAAGAVCSPYDPEGRMLPKDLLDVATVQEQAERNFLRRIERPLVRLSSPLSSVSKPSLLQEGVEGLLRQLRVCTYQTTSVDKHKLSRMLRLHAVALEWNGIQKGTPFRPLQPRDLIQVEEGKAVILHYQTEDCDGLEVVANKPREKSSCLPTEVEGDRETDYQVALGDESIREALAAANPEVAGTLGRCWRTALQHYLVSSLDRTNALRLSRPLQLQLHFLSGYEAAMLAQLIEAFDHCDKSELSQVLPFCLHNRNVCRLVVRTVLERYDFLWHWSTSLTNNRWFDLLGQFPIIGITRFPPTENFPATRNHALASIFRVLLGQGNWITRVITGGREGLITDNPDNIAQNLAAESNGFELANRNQYGTHFGRLKTNEFRKAHRLPTDESIVRTFVASPFSTLLNNGVVHVLRQLAKHWHNVLEQDQGNFSHQRMEQLDPIETLRFHMPELLQVLTSLRGRNQFDSNVFGPIILELQSLQPEKSTDTAKSLLWDLERCTREASGGIRSVLDPFRDWLRAIGLACDQLMKEAEDVLPLVSAVELGIRLGHDVIAEVSWRVPSDERLKEAILDYIVGRTPQCVDKPRIQRALDLTTPRDKRTFLELVREGLINTKPAQLLLSRVKTLLQRELRRNAMNHAILEMSKGEPEENLGQLAVNEWYWIEGEKVASGVYICLGRQDENLDLTMLHVESGTRTLLHAYQPDVRVLKYVPVAEAIVRAQKAFMTIELEHGKKLSYNAFMEISWLRSPLRRLATVAQLCCERLDAARINILSELQRCESTQVRPDEMELGQTYYLQDRQSKKYKPVKFVLENRAIFASRPVWRVSPQSLLVVGGGPAGLLTTIHCAENCLISGGCLKLYEARDAFSKGGSTFERAQIVRLDSRWIATMRYYLGTLFEDVFIPASGETDSQLGNTLPTQGFVEISIKDLENMLHTEVCRLWSRGIVEVFTDSKAQYDHETNSMTKFGRFLKEGDLLHCLMDAHGKPSRSFHGWVVHQLRYTRTLTVDEVFVGQEYGLFVRDKQAVLPYVLDKVDLATKIYHFRSLTEEAADIQTHQTELPCLYPLNTPYDAHACATDVVLKCREERSPKDYVSKHYKMDDIKDNKFVLDLGQTHIIEAIGKPQNSAVHFQVTTTEPYAVCCLSGLKVSMQMHNFGEKRFGAGILDDLRTINDQNTRIISDFTKMIRAKPIISGMAEALSSDEDWKRHFFGLLRPTKKAGDIIGVLEDRFQTLLQTSDQLVRRTLQTRFFETGDGFYLGMELPREYDKWKKETLKEILPNESKFVVAMRRKLSFTIDRLWFECCLSSFRQGDVYNPGARHRIPKFNLITSSKAEPVATLNVGESFRWPIEGNEASKNRYEILEKRKREVIVRNVEGFVRSIEPNENVKRDSDLARAPDGDQESSVSLASFEVAHYVNHRAIRFSNGEAGYVLAFAGDAQSTPHFMRYSGLTGACINAASFNKFIRGAIDGVPLVKRFRRFSQETNWSNGEVVHRGTGGCYGVDGFLRPGFSYKSLVNYLFSKVIEYRESRQNLVNLLSKDWKSKLAASIVPKGLEGNKSFEKKLRSIFQSAVFEKVLSEVEKDVALSNIGTSLRTARTKVNECAFDACTVKFWDELLAKVSLSESVSSYLDATYFTPGKIVCRACLELIQFAGDEHKRGKRISSELSNQPRPVDSVIDDFAVEAQNFANSLTLAAAFAAGAVSFLLIDSALFETMSALLGTINIFISFDTITNVSRYRIRNEEARIVISDKSFAELRKELFSLMDEASGRTIGIENHPFYQDIELKVARFRDALSYYDYEAHSEFESAYATFRTWTNDARQVESFREQLLTKFIPVSYQVNSYLKDALVAVYASVEQLHTALIRQASNSGEYTDVHSLFIEVLDFEPKLQRTLQRGPVHWGFVKRRKMKDWNLTASLRFLVSFVLGGFSRASSIEAKTRALTNKLENVHRQVVDAKIRRLILDLDTLVWATRESSIASLILVSATTTFFTSLVFTIARCLSLEALLSYSFVALTVSALGAVLALFHFYRKLGILIGLYFRLRSKKMAESVDTDRERVSQIEKLTTIQILLTALRLFAALLATIALPLAAMDIGFDRALAAVQNLPFWMAFASVTLALVSTMLFFFVEFNLRYNLTTQLGPVVCDLFRSEISHSYRDLTLTHDRSEAAGESRLAWEYTARDFLHTYRFDTLFAADRFGQVLQCIQSGIELSPKDDFRTKTRTCD